jgi:flagellar hook-associated protein 3 FlgL
MRITENMRYHNVLRDIGDAQRRMYRAQEQVSTGKKVTKPSDDPVAAADILRIKSEKSESVQYGRNLTFAKSKLQFTDGTLDSIGRLLERAVTVGQSSFNNETPAVFAEELKGIRDQLLAAANSSYGGRFIFGGSVTTQEPYEKNADGTIAYGGNSDAMDVAINRAVSVQTQVPGSEIFSGPVDVFRELADLATAIQAGDKTAIDAHVRQLDSATEIISLARAKVGNSLNRALSVEGDLTTAKLARDAELTDKEAADMAAAITELAASQQGLQATLAVGANISKLSILDFLK